MLIILEGIDCSGKSTLAVELANAIRLLDPSSDVEVRHSGPPTQHPLGEYESPLHDYRPGTNKHIIYDRFHWGEVVYPSVLKRATRFDGPGRLHVDMFLRSRGAFIVRVHAPRGVVDTCLGSRGDELVDHTMIDHIEYGYDDAQRMSLVPFTEVSGRVDIDSSVQSIIARASQEAAYAARLNPFVTYVGPHNPKLVLLGDVRHTVMPNEITPAFVPFGGTSGHFLLTALTRQFKVDELANIGIMNACDVDDHNALLTLVKPQRVVALGANASRATPHARRVHHPQYVRRFHHDQVDQYGHDISGFGSSLPRF